MWDSLAIIERVAELSSVAVWPRDPVDAGAPSRARPYFGVGATTTSLIGSTLAPAGYAYDT